MKIVQQADVLDVAFHMRMEAQILLPDGVSQNMYIFLIFCYQPLMNCFIAGQTSGLDQIWNEIDELRPVRT